MRRYSLLLCLLSTLASEQAAWATSTIVPDNFATVTAALSGSSADTVRVKATAPAEIVAVTRSVTIVAMPTTFSTVVVTPLPKLASVSLASGFSGGDIRLVGFHVLGTVNFTGYSNVQVEDCRIDGGVSISGGYTSMRRCQVTGSASVQGINMDAAQNTVVSGTLSVSCEGLGNATGNVVVGPAAIGIQVGGEVAANRNYVRGCTDGILIANPSAIGAFENVVEDCPGTGIAFRVGGGGISMSFVRNIVRRCGRGIETSGLIVSITDNLVEDSALEGIRMLSTSNPYALLARNTVLRSGGIGIVAGMPTTVRGNRVLQTGGDGMVIYDASNVDSNVVIRAGGRGIAIQGGNDLGPTISNNTIRASTQAGLSVTGGPTALPTEILRNLSTSNGGVGFQWSGAGTRSYGCNDWFANTGGTVSGTPPVPADVSLDPKYCNAGTDDLTLASTSPVLNLAGCGRVGALGLGCASPVSVVDGSGLESGELGVLPSPNRGTVRYSWAPLADPAALEVYDAAGALRWRQELGVGAREVEWQGVDRVGQALPAGIYFARLTGKGRQAAARVVLVR